jgi:hypothetical protein
MLGMLELMATGIHWEERFVEEESAVAIADELQDWQNGEKISERVLHFARRVDRLSESLIGVGEELCAGRGDRNQPEADIERLHFL